MYPFFEECKELGFTTVELSKGMVILPLEDLLAAMQRLVDQTQNYTFSPDDLKDWSGSILMVFGSEDPTTPSEKRQAMRVLYPQAEVKVFEGGEHGIAVSHQQEYYAVIDEFLAR